ncbi:ATP-binding protein [Coraliomargarita algicola]|uniref:ATP-binding protein n=1 Tax=Coraliomargarita algicola TaxID=3092156 RepID=A0ABZ0RM08_9BACT|nr:ATP-binding protein [Coraliomargarita sp. J2-16]WPJ93964.1 ATP-binding protein [Coraliomargarita sp. J2-16]
MVYNLRQCQNKLLDLKKKDRGRMIALTGARQVGKTTLAKNCFPELPILSMDSPLERETYLRYTPAQWQANYPRVILDEVQKAPDLFETIKSCYDRYPEMEFILLGSSQFLLMKGIRESLAGRAAIQNLYPYSLLEIAKKGDNRSLLEELLLNPDSAAQNLQTRPPDEHLKDAYALASKHWEALEQFGGMPALHQPGWDDTDRYEWLEDYSLAYLQRDLQDLAKLDRLEPFVRAQKIAALRTAQPINYSALARAADISAPTAKNFIHYLEISYQVKMIPSWTRNHEKRLSKMPKLHFLDAGVRRSILKKRGILDGHEFESTVASEIIKIVDTHRLPWQLHHLRTSDGREIDLLLEHEKGYIAIECKMTDHATRHEARHFKDLSEILDKPLLLNLVVSKDTEIQQLSDAGVPTYNISAIQLFS